jgi:hypothetical protein
MLAAMTDPATVTVLLSARADVPSENGIIYPLAVLSKIVDQLNASPVPVYDRMWSERQEAPARAYRIGETKSARVVGDRVEVTVVADLPRRLQRSLSGMAEFDVVHESAGVVYDAVITGLSLEPLAIEHVVQTIREVGSPEPIPMDPESVKAAGMPARKEEWAPPCPFCGGEATVTRMRNCDELRVKHKPGCFLSGFKGESRFHWNERERIPAVPFKDWCMRHRPLPFPPTGAAP